MSGNLLDVSRVAAILRDQHGLGNTDIGMGNQLSINQLIAHHAVVFKPDSLLAWVSAGPWQLGEFVAYDLKKVFDLDADHIQLNNEIYEITRAIPADSFLMTSAYRRFREYQSMTRELILLTKNRKQLPAGFESKYCHANPSLYMTYVRLGEYFENLKAHDKAVFYYREAMKRKLPGKDEENKLIEKTNHLVKKTRT